MVKKIAFIGHRNIPLSYIVREKLYKTVEQEILDGCKHFTMGTHGDFDEMALSVCRQLRSKYKDIEIEVVITSLHKVKTIVEHDEQYGDEIYKPYEDVKVVLYDIEEQYFKRRIIESNKQMINSSDKLIAYVNRKNTSSGAKYAYNYAKRKGLQLVNLYEPKDDPTYNMTPEQKKEFYDNVFAKYKKK